MVCAKSLYCLVSSANSLFSESVVRSCESHLQNYCIRQSDLQSVACIRFFSRLLKRTNLIYRTKQLHSMRAYIVVMMGIGRAYRLFPVCYTNEIIPYCYDCWPDTWESWQYLFERNKVKVAFFTSKQACEYFSDLNPNISCKWLPEATNSYDYIASIPLHKRCIDVLEMGRQYSDYHNRISDFLTGQYVHLFEHEPGQVIFPTTQLLVNGLADSKISICFPASITHPQKSQGIETVTHRYFESIASKCVILGKCPKELLEIFGYNPTIEVDMDNPSGQILDILSNINSYQSLVNQNYDRLLKVGTWEIRIRKMMDILLEDNSYQVSRLT